MNIEHWGPWKLIKTGFWLGIGFIIPTILVDVVTIASAWVVTPMVMNADFEELDGESFSFGQADASKIEINSQREMMNGNQLLVLGEFTNRNEKAINTIELEADLFDEDGVFVYQCSEYISKKVEAGAIENYQIKCGCSKNGVPDYDTLKVNVVSASSY